MKESIKILFSQYNREQLMDQKVNKISSFQTKMLRYLEDIDFNKNEANEKCETKVLTNQKIISLLRQSEIAKEGDYAIILKMLKNIEFFQTSNLQGSNENLLTIAKNLNYQFCKKGEVVFEIHSFGNTFYIIIEGSVSVLIPNETNSRHNEKESINEVTILKSGQCFGELALISQKPMFI